MERILSYLLIAFNLPTNVFLSLRHCTYRQISFVYMFKELSAIMDLLEWPLIYGNQCKTSRKWRLEARQIHLIVNSDCLTVSYSHNINYGGTYIEHVYNYYSFLRVVEYVKKATMNISYMYCTKTSKEYCSNLKEFLSKQLILKKEVYDQNTYRCGILKVISFEGVDDVSVMEIYLEENFLEMYNVIQSEERAKDIELLLRNIIEREKLK